MFELNEPIHGLKRLEFLHDNNCPTQEVKLYPWNTTLSKHTPQEVMKESVKHWGNPPFRVWGGTSYVSSSRKEGLREYFLSVPEWTWNPNP